MNTQVTARPGTQNIEVSADFNAPIDLVFKAHTNAKLYPQWLGPSSSTITLEVFEPKTGGTWQYVYRNQRGDQYIFRGVYHEVLPPNKIVTTFEFINPNRVDVGYLTLQTITFEELPDGKTRVLTQTVFQSDIARDMEARFAEHGIKESYERLNQLLEELQKQ